MLILGIDPGLNGALCMIFDSGSVPVDVIDMPTFSLSRNGKTRRQIDGYAINQWLQNGIGHAFVEQTWARPKEASSASFVSGRGYGLIEGLLIARGVPITRIDPMTWKKDMRVKDGKDGSLARASELLPDGKKYWPLKKHDGRAESALIALWGIRSLNGIARGEAA